MTRVVGAWLADHPETYGGTIGVTGDATLYRAWADAVFRDHLLPYSDFGVEYPPGALGLALVPAVLPGSYRTGLILLMLLFDGVALVALMRLARRDGSILGAWLWTLGVPLLGPIAYVRLDLAAAAATIWAAERLLGRRWLVAGALLGLAAAVKIYPLLLVLPALLAVGQRRRFLLAVFCAFGLTLLPFVASLTTATRDLVAFHSGRGIEIETIWGAMLLWAAKTSNAGVLEFGSGSLNVKTSLQGVFKGCSAMLTVGSILVCCISVARHPSSGRTRHLIDTWFALLTIVVAVATVLSPQYVLWVLAVGAAAVAQRGSVVRGTASVVLLICALTQLIYPFLFRSLSDGGSTALAVLSARDLLLLGCGVSAVLAIVRDSRSPPAARDRVAP